MSTTRVSVSHQRNSYRNGNGGTTMKRRIDNNLGSYVRDFQDERNRYTPPQKRVRSSNTIAIPHQRSQTQSQTQTHGRFPHSNVSRVSNNSSNNIPFALRNNNNNHVVNDDLSFDSLPEWAPNRSNLPILNSNVVPNLTGHNPITMMNHLDMVSIVSQALPPQQPIVITKELSDLLVSLNKDKSKQEPSLGLSFDNVSLTVRNESVIKSLYSDMPRQCSSCGVRFTCQEDHSKHMDWHVRKNRMVKPKTTKPKQSRNWFASVSLWLSASVGGTMEDATKAVFNTKKEEEVQKRECLVVADENQKNCALCIEPFEEFFSHEEDDWMYRDACYLKKEGFGPIVHVKCMPEPRKRPMKESITVSPVASAFVC